MRKPVLLWLLLALSACMPQEQTFNTQPAAQAKLEPDALHTRDEATLPYHVWPPEQAYLVKNPRAVIIALHGFNDYSHAYETTGLFFRQRGMAVYAYDQRGFGQSPDPGIWASEPNLAGDLKQFIGEVARKYPRSPIYLLGESMGGAVVIDAVSDPACPHVQGVILSAPAVWGAETMSPVYRGTLWLAAHTIPYKQFTGSDLKILASNNIPMLRRLSKDPLVIKKTRVDAVYGVVHLMDTAYEKVPAVKTRVMLLYGGKDQVIPHRPVERALERFTVPVDYVYYPEGYHMLLRDLQGESVMEDIYSWIRSPAAPLPSGLGTKHTPPEKSS